MAIWIVCSTNRRSLTSRGIVFGAAERAQFADRRLDDGELLEDEVRVGHRDAGAPHRLRR
jgi:hypothetical protein